MLKKLMLAFSAMFLLAGYSLAAETAIPKEETSKKSAEVTPSKESTEATTDEESSENTEIKTEEAAK